MDTSTTNKSSENTTGVATQVVDPEEKMKALEQMGEDARGMDVDLTESKKKKFFTRKRLILILVSVVCVLIGGAITVAIIVGLNQKWNTQKGEASERAENSTIIATGFGYNTQNYTQNTQGYTK